MRFTVIKPIITEMSMKDSKSGKFTFLVAKDATKPEIRKEIQNVYGVTVTGITTVTMRTNRAISTRFGRKNVHKELKKARVALLKGQTIPAFEIPEEGKKPSSAKASEGQGKRKETQKEGK